jgi:molecular chaperone Hsp33
MAEGAAGDDEVLPFQIERSGLRGRMVRLGPLLEEILTRHAHPMPVARLLGETVALACLLAGALKYQGVFTLQTRSDGPISTLMADVTSVGDVRGYARFDGARLPGEGDVPAMLGAGHLAFTVDQGPDTERYQGIVALEGATLAACLQHYFRQSEQVDAGLKVAVGRAGGTWRAAGLMVQRLPEPGAPDPASDREDDWRRAMVLMASATDGEMLDPDLPPDRLLYRLFHEDGCRVWAPAPLRAACRCSRERVVATLAALPRAEIEELKVDGVVRVTCEFCNAAYVFDDLALAGVWAT